MRSLQLFSKDICVLHRRRLSAFLSLGIVCLCLLPAIGYATVSVNLPLDDPAYPLLEKLVSSNLTFTNALTIKPITRLHAARIVAEAIAQRRREVERLQRQEPFIDAILAHLARRFKRELQQIGFLTTLRRPKAVFTAPLAELKLETVFARHQFVLRDSSGETANLQGVFARNEGFAYGENFSLRVRTESWADFWNTVAIYVEPEAIIRSNPLFGEQFDYNLHKGYIKASYANLELAFGRDTLAWGPASQGDLILSNNAPPLDLLKFSTPLPFRFPGVFAELGEWQMAYFVAQLEADRSIPHALLQGLRFTFQPSAYLKFGFTSAFQAFGRHGVSLDGSQYVRRLFISELDNDVEGINGLRTYDVVVTVPFVRSIPFLQSIKFYWERGNDNVSNATGLLGGGNILGGILDGGRWDVRFEFAETRDGEAIWYTHPVYRSGFALKQFNLGHPIGGAAQSFFARASYYITPTAWLAADGRYEQYGLDTQPQATTQQRFGLEGSYQLPWLQHELTLWGRVEYATLDDLMATDQRTLNAQFSVRWHF